MRDATAPVACIVTVALGCASCAREPAWIPGISDARMARATAPPSSPTSSSAAPHVTLTAEPVAPAAHVNLDSWTGTFIAHEECGKSEEGDKRVASHRIKIVKQDDQWFAEVTSDGYQTATHLRGRVDGTPAHVKLVMVEALAENLTDGIEPSEVLLEWKRDGSRLSTAWKKLVPLCENKSEPQFTQSRVTKGK